MNHQPDSEFNAIVIGGSAGSIKVVKDLLQQIEFVPDIPMIIGLHRAKQESTSPGSLKQVFQYGTAMPVIEPVHRQPLLPGVVYLAPANHHLRVRTDHTFSLSDEQSAYSTYPSIDLLLSSAAETYRDRLIGILLTGATRDGALGMKQVQEKGGLTIVQNPKECIGFTMPQAAIEVARIDHVFSASQIAKFLNHLFNRHNKISARTHV